MILVIILAVMLFAVSAPILWYSIGTMFDKEEDQ